MGARGDLRHDAAVGRMLVVLRQHDVGQDLAAAVVGAPTSAAAVSSQVVSMPRTSIAVFSRIAATAYHCEVPWRNPPPPSCGSARAAARWRWRRPRMTRDALRGARLRPGRVEIVAIRTTGDRIQDRPLAEAGGKGLFTKEIEEALLDRPHRPRGAFVEGHADLAARRAGARRRSCRARTRATRSSAARRATWRDLPHGAVVGTASLRRQAMLQRHAARSRGRAVCAAMSRRGCASSTTGEVDATLLALAGLKRLGLADAATALLDSTNFCRRSGRARSASRRAPTMRRRASLLAPIDHADTAMALVCERAFLAVLDGSCRTPIAGHATVATAMRIFRGMILKPDGSETFETARSGAVADAEALGADAGAELKGKAGPDFFARDMRLLVTRPEPDANAPRRSLRARGHEVMLAPLLRIEPVIDADFGRAVGPPC